MLVYIPSFLISIFSAYFAGFFKNKYDFDKKNKKYLVYFILLIFAIFLALFIPSAFRYGIAYDYFYTDDRVLNEIRNGVEGTGFNEVFVTLLAKLIVNLNLTNQAYFILLSFITVVSFLVGIFINKKNEFLLPTVILIFYGLYINTLNQVRSGVGISLGILAFSIIYNFKNKWTIVLAYLLCAIGTLFHYSEFINFVIITLYLLINKFNNKLNNKVLLTILICLIAVTPFLFIILKYTIDYIPILKNYSYYFSPNGDVTFSVLAQSFGTLFLFAIPFINAIFYLRHFTETNDGMLKFSGIIIFINFIFMIIGFMANSTQLADRTKSMFYLCDLFIVPCLYKNIENKTEKYIYLIVVLITMFIFLLVILFTSGAYPYRSIFFKGIYIY